MPVYDRRVQRYRGHQRPGLLGLAAAAGRLGAPYMRAAAPIAGRAIQAKARSVIARAAKVASNRGSQSSNKGGVVDKRNEREELNALESASGLFSYSTFRLSFSPPKSKTLWSQVNPQHDYYQASARVNALANTQEPASPVALLDTPGLQRLFNAAVGGTVKSGRVYVEKCTAELLMTNNENESVIVDIYDLFCHHSSQAGTNNLPDLTWDEGAKADGYTAGNQLFGTTPGITKRFGRFWSIKKKTTVMLAAGASHQHYVCYNANKSVSYDFINRANVNSNLAGITYFTMFTVRGLPEHDATTKTAVGTPVVHLDYITSQIVTFKYMASTPTSNIATGNLGTVASAQVFGPGPVAEQEL